MCERESLNECVCRPVSVWGQRALIAWVESPNCVGGVSVCVRRESR